MLIQPLGTIATIQINKNCEITFFTNEYLHIEDMVKVFFNEQSHYFQINNIITTRERPYELAVTAIEIGYYNKLRKSKDVDLRQLLCANVILVIDEEEKKKINNESCYC